MALSPAPLPALGLNLDATGYVLNADTGYFDFNGRSDQQSTYSTALKSGRILTAAYGSFSETGQDATTTKGTPIGGGNPAPLLIYGSLLEASTARSLIADPGIFSCTRSDFPAVYATNLRRGKSLAAETGYISLLGAPAERDMEMNADYNAFAINGKAAILSVGYKMSAAYGSFTLAGQDSAGTVQDAQNFRLTAEPGIFSTDRSDNASLSATMLLTTRILVAEYGPITLTGTVCRFVSETWGDITPETSTWTPVTPATSVWNDV